MGNVTADDIFFRNAMLAVVSRHAGAEQHQRLSAITEYVAFGVAIKQLANDTDKKDLICKILTCIHMAYDEEPNSDMSE